MKRKPIMMFSICMIILLINTIFFNTQDPKTTWYLNKINVEHYNKKANIVKIGIIDSGYYNLDNIEKSYVFSGGHNANPHGSSNIDLIKEINNEAIIYSYEINVQEDNQIIQALDQALIDELKILVLPFGVDTYNEDIDQRLKQLHLNNTIIVAAVGDDNEVKIMFPALSEYTIPIGALTAASTAWEWNNGIAHTYYLFPGDDINIYNANTFPNHLQLVQGNGTSFATAIAGAYISLIIDNDMNKTDIENILSEIRIKSYKKY
jgi:hypothetical protein